MTEKTWQMPGGFGNKGKEFTLGFQNLKSCISRGDNSGSNKEQVWADVTSVTSVFNGVADISLNTTLTLDIVLRVERGKEGSWFVLSSKVNEVGPVAVKPSGEYKPQSFKTVLTRGSGPRPQAAWKPKAQAGPHKPLLFKSGPKRFSTKSTPKCFISSGTQPSASASTDTVKRAPEIASSKALSSLACNNTEQVSVTSSLPCGSSSLGCENMAVAGTSLLVPNLVVPGSGSLLSPSSTACDTAFGLPPLFTSKLSDQPPLYTQKMGNCNLTSDAEGVESVKEYTESIGSSQHAVGSENTEPLFTKWPHEFGPRISDFVGDLSKTWGNSKDWMLELRDGKKIVIPLSVYRSPKAVSEQPELEEVANPGLVSPFNEGQIISWDFECEGVGGFVVFDFGSEGVAWDSDEGLLDWDHLGDPLEVAPLAMDNSVVMEIPTAEKIGGKADVDNIKLSQWVTNRIKAFQKSVGTSLEGFKEQVIGLLFALEERRKKRMLDVAFKRKLGKAEHKGHRELKSLLSSWGEENETERNRCTSRERAVVVHK